MRAVQPLMRSLNRRLAWVVFVAAAIFLEWPAYADENTRATRKDAVDADALMVRGVAELEAGDAAGALVHFQLAADALGEKGDIRQRGGLLYMQGRALHELRRYTEAIDAFRRAAEDQRSPDDVRALAYTLHAWGDAEAALGDSAAAQSSYERALVARRSARDGVGEVRTLINLVQSEAMTGQWGAAIGHLQEVRLLLQRIELLRLDLARFANSVGLLQALMGQLDLAQLEFARAREIYAQLGDDIGQSESLRNAAYLKVQQGNYEAAHALYVRAQQVLLADRVVERASALNGIGYCLVRLGRGSEAVAPLLIAVAALRTVPDSLELARTLESLGSAHLQAGDPAAALREYVESLQIARERHSPEDEREVLFSLGRLAVAQGQANAAILYLKASVSVSQDLRTGAAGLGLDSRRALATRLSEPYKLLARLLIEMNREAEGEGVLMALKEVEFSGYVRAGGGEGPGLLSSDEQEEFAALNDLGVRLARLGAQLRARDDRGAVLSDEAAKSLETKRLAAEGDMQALLRQIDIRLKRPPDVALELKISDSQWREVAQHLSHHPLGESSVVVTFAAEERKTTLLIVGPAGARSRALPVGSKTLDELVTLLRTNIEGRADYKPAARELHHHLIEPVEQLLEENGWEAKTWMLFLTDRLRYLPISALIGPDGHHVIESHRLATLTTPAIIRMRDEPRQDWAVMAFANTQGYPQYQASPLPAARSEVEGIVRTKDNTGGVMPGQMLLDDDFTRDAWLQIFQVGDGPAPMASVVHVASHFISRQRDWSHSFLLLGGGEQYLMAELNSGSLLLNHLDLVTISACETEVNDQALGNELEGLGVSLQKRGARAVIGTLWSVADEATATLMRAFYRSRGAKRVMSKAAALQAAQLNLLHSSDGRFQHPYYWASFVLMGNWL